MLNKIRKRINRLWVALTNKTINFELRHYPNMAVRLLKRNKVLKGTNFLICKNIWFHNYKQVEINDGCAINSDVKFCTEGSAEAKITIGKNVAIAKGVIFETGMHEIGPSSKRCGAPLSKNIEVGDGTWIGIGSIICPGVKIGNGCIIQAGSVVVKDCKPNCLYAGNPATLIMKLPKE